ncbi:hypothetical protein GOV07_02615, partial [Candidatus Woesearchaeota archaeon]|nr:hypothetical protein [Candidatus Woesearchaeota archaeon]
MQYVFAADIGGTNMRFAILDEKLGIVKKEIIPTQETKNFHKAVDTFISKAAKEGFPVKKGGFSVA